VMTTEHEHRQVIGLHRGFLPFGTVTYNFGSTMSAIVDHIHQKSPEYRKLVVNLYFTPINYFLLNSNRSEAV